MAPPIHPTPMGLSAAPRFLQCPFGMCRAGMFAANSHLSALVKFQAGLCWGNSTFSIRACSKWSLHLCLGVWDGLSCSWMLQGGGHGGGQCKTPEGCSCCQAGVVMPSAPMADKSWREKTKKNQQKKSHMSAQLNPQRKTTSF